MSHCGCSHCDCDDDNSKKDARTPEEKFSDLKEDIKKLGYEVEDAGHGEIKISE